MTIEAKAALFIMLGQTAEKTVAQIENIVPNELLLDISRVRLGSHCAGQGAGRHSCIGSDLPLNFHPVAIRVSADVTPFGAG